MNAPLPKPMTDNSSALPDAWIERIFAVMLASYGSKFADLWRGSDLSAVKTVWANKLAGFADQPKAIKAALDALDERPFPPTLPEFLTLCRDAGRRIRDDKPSLPHKSTPEDEARAKEAAGKALAALKPKYSDGIDRHWATHPRSAMHLQMVFEAAKKDPRFRSCVEEMTGMETCTRDGRLLKVYRDGDFVAAKA